MDNELYYSVDQRPPLVTQILLGLQHCLGITSTLAVPLIIFGTINLPLKAEAQLISSSLLVLGIAAILMSLKSRYLGTGFLCPLLCEPAFLVVSKDTVQLGGLSLLFGMVFVAGVFQALFAFIYPLIRRFFSTEVSGIVVLMVGLSLVKPDLVYSTGSHNLQNLSFDLPSLITAGITLLTMLILVIWNLFSLSRYCLLIGIIIGMCVAAWQGLLNATDFAKIIHTPLFSAKINFTLPNMRFNLDLIIPFVIASIAMTLKGMGGIINCQKINNPNWVRPEQSSVRKGIFTNAIAIIISSCLGGVGLGVANNNIGLSVATKVTSRYVGITTGILLIVFAFIPKISMLFVIMPKPVIGAALVFVTSYVIVAGIQILSSRLLDTRKIFIIGLSLMTGIMIQIHPTDLSKVPSMLRPILNSPIIMTTLTAIILNLLLGIGAKIKTSLKLNSPCNVDEELDLFMRTEGKHWGAVPRLIDDALIVIKACLQELAALGVNNPIQLKFCYTDYALNVGLSYQGAELNSFTSGADNPNSPLQLASTLIRESMPELTIKSGKDPKNPQLNFIELNFIQ